MKSIKVFGARAKLETTYATSSTPANADAILLSEMPVLKIGYANDGSRALPPGTMGFQNRVAPSGRVGEVPLKFEPRGAAAAYSALVFPNIHPMLRAAGFDAAGTFGVGVEKWVYTPTPGPITFGSVSLDLFGRQQQYSMVGVYGDFTLGAAGPVVPTLEIPCKGLLSTIADAALPALAYGTVGAILPPKSVALGFSFNGVTSLKIKSWSLKLGRTINPRMDQNANGHAGFAIGLRAPMFEFVVENEALTLLDAYTLRDAGTAVVGFLTCGTVQYNKHRLDFPAMQVVDIADETEEPVATVKIACQLNPSALGLSDECSWTFN